MCPRTQKTAPARLHEEADVRGIQRVSVRPQVLIAQKTGGRVLSPPLAKYCRENLVLLQLTVAQMTPTCRNQERSVGVASIAVTLQPVGGGPPIGLLSETAMEAVPPLTSV